MVKLWKKEVKKKYLWCQVPSHEVCMSGTPIKIGKKKKKKKKKKKALYRKYTISKAQNLDVMDNTKYLGILVSIDFTQHKQVKRVAIKGIHWDSSNRTLGKPSNPQINVVFSYSMEPGYERS